MSASSTLSPKSTRKKPQGRGPAIHSSLLLLRALSLASTATPSDGGCTGHHPRSKER